ncbi:MAG TPA: putative glycosyltransferase, exosortase G system-associated [Firmicutes bacterium]|nr:putative glycosyltransferase, exosortase G system-associated [Bacillota bacterium]
MNGMALLNFLLFWGVWLLIPMLLDGLTAAAYLWAAFTTPPRHRRPHRELEPYPLVSIVVPVLNAERTLKRCLASVAGQDYPLSKLELICVDNGSTDHSFRAFSEAQQAFPGLRMGWITLKGRGKWRALNAGIHQAIGTYILNLDADVNLAPGAVREMVSTFEEDAGMVAATGDIRVEEVPLPLGAARWVGLLRACESLEYLTAFMVGRTFQARYNGIYTLAGAFSAFRRDLLLRTFLYDSSTVSEDTKLTFDIRARLKTGERIGFVEGAVAYVEPINSLRELFSQRVRWQRGQIEVASLHPHYHTGGFLGSLRFSTARMLVSDHTLAFPRLTWTFLLPFLFLLGYPLPLVGAALASFYVCYAFIDALFVAAMYWRLSPHDSLRKRVRHDLPVLPLLPLYRQLLYWFRLSGMLYSLTEPGTWAVESPFAQTRRALRQTLARLRSFIAQLPAPGTRRPPAGA